MQYNCYFSEKNDWIGMWLPGCEFWIIISSRYFGFAPDILLSWAENKFCEAKRCCSCTLFRFWGHVIWKCRFLAEKNIALQALFLPGLRQRRRLLGQIKVSQLEKIVLGSVLRFVRIIIPESWKFLDFRFLKKYNLYYRKGGWTHMMRLIRGNYSVQL